MPPRGAHYGGKGWIKTLISKLPPFYTVAQKDHNLRYNACNAGKALTAFAKDLPVYQKDLVVLPKGATPVDFAYHIHTDIGNHCAGAKVNGRRVPLNYRLQNGEKGEDRAWKCHIRR